MATNQVSAELAALSEQLRERTVATAATTSPSVGRPSTPSELEGLIRELGELLAQQTKEAEETLAEHPWVAIAGAFTLGFVIGRLTSRG